MLFRLPPEALVLLIPTLIFALSFHEFAHAWMAYRCGDNTASRMGRLTLNPIAHLDIFGSMMILFVGFGWAKPVPVDSRYLNNPREDMVKVAAAGPLSNLLLAVLSAISLRILFTSGFLPPEIKTFLIIFMQINITLAVFNLLPISPLDGAQILTPFIEKHFGSHMVYKMEMYGPRVLFFVIIFSMVTGIHIFSLVITPIFNFFLFIFF